LGEKCLGDDDKRHAEMDYRIEKRCSITCDRRHVEINFKINPSIDGSEEPKILLKE
jgi:hypothetical protein